MTTSDYLINVALVAVVFLQLHGRRLGAVQMLWPLGLVGYFAIHYLHVLPTAGNDLVLVGIGTAAGLVLGAGSGLLTRIHRRDGEAPIGKATVPAALLWIAGVGARMGFALYAQHGGGLQIARFSSHHGITSSAAWVDALVLMALVEVVARTFVLAWRAYGDQTRTWLTSLRGNPAGGMIRPL